MTSTKYIPKDDLEHSGILGMKWGKRKADSEEHVTSRKLARERMSALTNSEIEAVTKRLSLEKKLKEVTTKKVSPEEKKAREVLMNQLWLAASPFIAGFVGAGVKAWADHLKKKYGAGANVYETGVAGVQVVQNLLT